VFHDQPVGQIQGARNILEFEANTGEMVAGSQDRGRQAKLSGQPLQIAE
jgi:hypothetical protein